MRWLLAAAGLVVGLGAVLLAGAASTLSVRAARVESFQRTGDPRKIVANVVIGLDDEILGASAAEDATTVRIAVRIKPPTGPGFRPAIGIGVPVVVMLKDAIGDRAVFDASSGASVRDLGMYQVPREPPVDLSTEIGQVDRASFRAAGDVIDFRWTNLNRTKSESRADRRGATVVLF
jgi:hypothetical protein